MKISTLAFAILFVAPPVFAKDQDPKKPTATSAAPASQAGKKACLAKMEKTVRETAVTMGLKLRFGVQFLNANSDVKDSSGKPLLEFSTGTFVTDQGYLSHSGATVLVRETTSSCDILKISVSIGG